VVVAVGLEPVAVVAVVAAVVPAAEAAGWAAVAVGVVVLEWEAAVAASLAYT
jgi:hypothetical protein